RRATASSFVTSRTREAEPVAASIDDEVRAAAIARVLYLRELYGGRIPRSALMEGVTINNERVPLFNPGRGIHKPAAFGATGAALSIVTSTDSPYDDVHDEESGRIVYKYQGSDPANNDNSAVRRAMEEQRPLIYLIGV